MSQDGNRPGRFFEWTPFALLKTESLDHDAAWDKLYYRYTTPPLGTSRKSLALKRVLAVARENRAGSVVTEYRYIDADYRDEHSRFYSGTFRRYPSVCHRLHFFQGRVLDLDAIRDSAGAASYLGYSIMRPLEKSPVGRTMLVPPEQLRDGVVCTVEEKVNLFGWEFRVRGVPFISQDAQFFRCAHASQWIILRHAHYAHEAPTKLPTDVHDASTGGLVVGRQLPSSGLSLAQMLDGLGRLGVSPSTVDLPESADESARRRQNSLNAVLCRYVNSQLPPVVVSNDHSRVIVGYTSAEPFPSHETITLYVHDDARGPYLPVDPWEEGWKVAVAPLPPKFHITAEKAEELGRQWFERAASKVRAESAEASWQDEPPHAEYAKAVGEGHIHYMTYAIHSNGYKAGLSDRGLGEPVERLYRLAQWPRYVWVVEGHHRKSMEKGDASVVGEVILDPTSHQYADVDDESALALHFAGRAWSRVPDHDAVPHAGWESFTPYRSGCALAG